jgi:hypothetical protein
MPMNTFLDHVLVKLATNLQDARAAGTGLRSD